MTVQVIAQIATLDELHKILQGWQDAMAGDGGAEWLVAAAARGRGGHGVRGSHARAAPTPPERCGESTAG